MQEIDRKKDWTDFSTYMHNEYLDRTIEKYSGGITATGVPTPDLMHWTPTIICYWNILKYVLRLWNAKGKGRELEKIAHYAQIAWTKENKQVKVEK